MSEPELQLIDSRAEIVGDGLPIHRALPSRLRRMVGPWCFLDHMGPTELAQSGPLHVGPHPHIGLQTVTWLLDGEILHRDSLGSLQPIRPGQLNVMTAGRGISHSEESPAAASGRLHGVQFWIALPDAARQLEPMFDHYPELPVIEQDGLRLTLIVGDWLGRQSPARHFSPTLGVDVEARTDSRTTLPLRDDFEYAVFLLGGSAEIEGQPLAPEALLYLGSGRRQLNLAVSAGTRFMLIGGTPFGEPMLMWWNFVARDKTEILQACHDWNAGAPGFGTVEGYTYGPRLTAPLPPWSTPA